VRREYDTKFHRRPKVEKREREEKVVARPKEGVCVRGVWSGELDVKHACHLSAI